MWSSKLNSAGARQLSVCVAHQYVHKPRTSQNPKGKSNRRKTTMAADKSKLINWPKIVRLPQKGGGADTSYSNVIARSMVHFQLMTTK